MTRRRVKRSKEEMDTMSTTDRDKARALLRGWQAGINGAQCRASAAAPIAAVAYALLDLGDTIRAARTEGATVGEGR
jgi:hypothetical protein